MYDPGYEMEAIEDERRDADMLQAQYEREGNQFAREQREMERLRGLGRLDEAADICNHSGGYPLDSPAAGFAEDPAQGEEGWRCVDCGSRLSELHRNGEVLVPCEIGRPGTADTSTREQI